MPVFLLYHFLVKKSIKANKIKGKRRLVQNNILIAHIVGNRKTVKNTENITGEIECF